MKTKNILLILIIILCITGCKNKTAKIEIDKEKLSQFADTRTKKIINSKLMSDLFVMTKIIDLETSDNALIGTIEDIILIPEANKIIVLHQTTKYDILVFDFQGKFLHRIGKLGDGPGEYRNPRPIAYINNKLVVYSQNRKLLFFNLDGSLLSEISFSERKWNFTIQKMAFYKNDLYAYTNNSYFNFANNKRNRVFRLTNFSDFSNSFGEAEETFGLEGGDIALFNNKIIFAGVYDGNIYKILPEKNECLVFTSFGELYNLENIRKSSDKINYIVKNIKELNAFLKLAVIDSFLFVKTIQNLIIVDSTGNILNKQIKDNLPSPQEFEGNAMRLERIFYNHGFIQASIRKSRITETSTPNPSLIIYESKFR